MYHSFLLHAEPSTTTTTIHGIKRFRAAKFLVYEVALNRGMLSIESIEFQAGKAKRSSWCSQQFDLIVEMEVGGSGSKALYIKHTSPLSLFY